MALTLLQKYARYEADNNHNAAAGILVNNFGTDEEKEQLKGIIARHKKLGYLTDEDNKLRYSISQKYYPLIVNNVQPPVDACPSRDDAQPHIFENGICTFCLTKK